VLLRRITGYLKDQNWFAVWLDVAIVFLGVFIGLQANNWNEARVARGTANTYYARLAEDMSAELTMRLARIEYLERTKSHGEAALNALEREDGALGAQFLIDIYQTTQVWYFTINRNTYDELLAGRISTIIPDSDLRARLANFYVGSETGATLQAETTPLRNNLRRHMPHSIQSTIREHCGDQITYLGNYVQQLSLPDVCEIEFDTQDVAGALDELRKYTSLKQDLRRHLADLEAKLHSLRASLDPLQETTVYLQGLLE